MSSDTQTDIFEIDDDEARRQAIIERAYALRAFMDKLSEDLPDEDVAEGPGVDMLPLWNPGQTYEVGDRCRWQDKAYSVLQAHTAQADWSPDKVPALYRRIEVGPDIPEWVQPTGAHDAYNAGDKVKHNGAVWESLIDANVWEPTEAVSNLWKKLGEE